MLLEAKQNNINVSSSVAIHNLILTDNTLSDFDSNYKVLPPLRSTTDQKTLVEGLKEGIIDVITSDHYPHEIEAKKKEFNLADRSAVRSEAAGHSNLPHPRLRRRQAVRLRRSPLPNATSLASSPQSSPFQIQQGPNLAAYIQAMHRPLG